MDNFIVLIPPSEGKAEGGGGEPLKQYPRGVEEIHKRFLKCDGSYKHLIGVRGDYLEKSIERNKNILETPTMPAIQRYTGTVYKYLDYETVENKEYLHSHIYITSAMFGLVKATQEIPNYKLKMSKLRAYKWWKKKTKEFLEDFFVVDVLTTTHRKSVSYEEGIEIDFKIARDDGTLRGAGHSGKKIKGKFVRYLAEKNVTTLEGIKEFSRDGFSWEDGSFVRT